MDLDGFCHGIWLGGRLWGFGSPGSGIHSVIFDTEGLLRFTACGGGAVSHDACHNDNKDQQ